MADEQAGEPSRATGIAALRAGWSHSHRDVSGGWLRPTVFGMVDGLVTNASLFAFSFGALVPLLPWLLGAPYLAATLALTAVALTVGGMAVGRLTGRPVLRSGLRQVALGGLAVAATFGVGHLIGAHGA